MKKILYFSAIICLFVGCRAQKELVSIDKETNEVVLSTGQSCEIEFVTNASTGYHWELVNENEINIVKNAGNRYVNTAPKEILGASCLRFWKFEAVEKGTQTLHFAYMRGNVDEAIRTRKVTITVK